MLRWLPSRHRTKCRKSNLFRVWEKRLWSLRHLKQDKVPQVHVTYSRLPRWLSSWMSGRLACEFRQHSLPSMVTQWLGYFTLSILDCGRHFYNNLSVWTTQKESLPLLGQDGNEKSLEHTNLYNCCIGSTSIPCNNLLVDFVICLWNLNFRNLSFGCNSCSYYCKYRFLGLVLKAFQFKENSSWNR